MRICENRTVIITGAGGGLGRAYAMAFGQAGANVVVNDIRIEAATQVAAEVTVAGGQALANQGDITSMAGAQSIVDAAVAAGTRTPVIIWRHILPNTLAPITVQATYICASAMIVESILSFIGAGTPPIIPSWGNIMAEGRALWQVKPYIVFFPAIFLSITVLAVNLLGDGLRDALDPRMAKRL